MIPFRFSQREISFFFLFKKYLAVKFNWPELFFFRNGTHIHDEIQTLSSLHY